MNLNNIKDKFNDREIQPGADSWEKLSQRLDRTDAQSKKPILLWLTAAAAVLVLGLTTVPSLFSHTDVTPLDRQMVIETPEVETPLRREPYFESNSPESVKETVPEVAREKEAIATVENTTKATQKTAETKKAPISSIQDIALEQPEKAAVHPTTLQTGVAQAAPEVLVPTEPQTPFNEANALLDKALKQVQGKEAMATTINPTKLLRETEWDLEAQRHNRLENTLLDGLGRLKREAVALIDRNQ